MTSRLLILSLIIICTSCVDTLSFETEDESHIFVNCEMTKDNKKVIACVFTSNNLNGTQPITSPESAIVQISSGTETPLNLVYDSKENVYTNSTDLDWRHIKNLELNIRIPDSDIENVRSRVGVLKNNTIETIMASEPSIVVSGEDEFYQRELTVVFNTPTELEAYYQLNFTEKITTTDIADGEEVLIESGEALATTDVEFLSGGAGVVVMNHKNGLLIDQSRLIDNQLTFVLTSSFPIQLEKQTFSKIHTNLGTISKTYYDYHKAKSNTFLRNEGVLLDRTIWGSNIENGFGLFSSTSESSQSFEF